MIDFFEGMDKKQIGAYIKRERVARGYTTRELGELVKVSPQNVTNWEAGKSAPNEGNINKILLFFRDKEPLPHIELEYELYRRHWWPGDLAKRLGVHLNTVYKWLQKGEIHIQYRRKIAQLFVDEPREKYDIKAIREKCHIDIDTAANFMKVTPQTIELWERYRAKPRLDAIDKLLAFYRAKENVA